MNPQRPLSEVIANAVDAMNMKAKLASFGVPPELAGSLRFYALKIRTDQFEPCPRTAQFDRENPGLLEELFFQAQKPNAKVLQRLWTLVRSNPDVPILWNYLTAALRNASEHEAATAVTVECYFRFPTYLSGFVNYLGMLLHQGRIEDAERAMDNKLMPNDVDPSRQEFHISEFMNFMTMRVHLLMATEKLDDIAKLASMFESFPDSGHPSEAELRRLFDRAAVSQLVKKAQDRLRTRSKPRAPRKHAKPKKPGNQGSETSGPPEP